MPVCVIYSLLVLLTGCKRFLCKRSYPTACAILLLWLLLQARRNAPSCSICFIGIGVRAVTFFTVLWIVYSQKRAQLLLECKPVVSSLNFGKGNILGVNCIMQLVMGKHSAVDLLLQRHCIYVVLLFLECNMSLVMLVKRCVFAWCPNCADMSRT